MTRRDWWIGVVLVAFALVAHAAWPRYEYRTLNGAPRVRVDRWTGRAQIGDYTDGGTWHPRREGP